MRAQSRRDFLKQTTLAGAAMAAGSKAAQACNGAPQMIIARWQVTAAGSGFGNMSAILTEGAIDALGGMGRFVKTGDVVWIKPNATWNRASHLAANTNPDVVGTLVRLCRDAGAKQVKVGDHTPLDPRLTYHVSGIAATVQANGGELVHMEKTGFRDYDLKGRYLHRWPVYPGALEADVLINVPVAKHHALHKASLAMRNLMGLVENRNAFHKDLPGRLTDLAKALTPDLNVLDATRVLTRRGPTGGDEADVACANTVAAGTDIVAIDAFGASLLGIAPESLDTAVAAANAGLGTLDYRSLRHRELALT